VTEYVKAFCSNERNNTGNSEHNDIAVRQKIQYKNRLATQLLYGEEQGTDCLKL
jgi:hypothetical protein